MSCIPWRLVLAALSPSRQTQHYHTNHKLDPAAPDQNHRLIHESKTVSHDDELPAHQNRFLVHQYQLSSPDEQLPTYHIHIPPSKTPQLARLNAPTQKNDPAHRAGTLDVETLRHDFPSQYSPFFSQPSTPQSLGLPQDPRPRTRQTPQSYQARDMDVEALMARLEALAEEQERGEGFVGGFES